jgi:hypothetical protein
VKSRDKGQILEASLDVLAESIVTTENGAAKAALFRQLNDVLDKLAELPRDKSDSPLARAKAAAKAERDA